MKSFPQNVRFAVFKLVDIMMTRHREGMCSCGRWLTTVQVDPHSALKSMGKRFIAGYVGLAEGEKDPRNLVISFAIVRVMLIEFDVSSQIEVRRQSMQSQFSPHKQRIAAESLRYNILLFPDHFHSPARWSIWLIH